MQIAYVVYDGFTGLDLVGPYEIMSRWPNAEVHFLATATAPVRADMGLTVSPTDTPDALPSPDIVVIGGASNPIPVMHDEALLEWVRKAAQTATWMASVCTGAGVYASAGLLEGRRTTTHFAFRGNLRAMGMARDVGGVSGMVSGKRRSAARTVAASAFSSDPASNGG